MGNRRTSPYWPDTLLTTIEWLTRSRFSNQTTCCILLLKPLPFIIPSGKGSEIYRQTRPGPCSGCSITNIGLSNFYQLHLTQFPSSYLFPITIYNLSKVRFFPIFILTPWYGSIPELNCNGTINALASFGMTLKYMNNTQQYIWCVQHCFRFLRKF